MLWLRRSFFLGLLVCHQSFLISQDVTAGVRGTVTDASGAVTPAAQVRIVNVNTGLARAVRTDESGRYTFTLLPVGTYNLSVQREGFKKYEREAITLTANQVAGINATLEVGQLAETVEVGAYAPVINTQTSEVSTLVDSQQVKELPLNGRNIVQLATLTNGVTYASIPAAVQDNPNGAINKMSVNGNRVNAIQFILDGADFGDPRFNVALNYPNPDAVQEFRFITSNYSAEFGKNPGGVLNVITKSGTNRIHGSAWEFNRNSAVAARDFFLASKAPLNQNQFGFGVGGPAIKDKLFWFGSTQWLRIRQGKAVTTAFPPTAAERAGDFSASTKPVIDPDTLLSFPGNQIPKSRIDPIAAKYLTLVPFPNSADGRFIGAFKDITNDYQITLRPDYMISARDRLSVTVFKDSSAASSLVAFAGEHNLPFTGDLTGWRQFITADQINVIGNYTSTLRPNLLNNLRFGYTDLSWGVNGNGHPTIRDLGSNFPQSTFVDSGEVRPGGPPGVSITDRFIKSRGYIWYLYNDKYQFSDNIDYIRGGHRLHFGFEFIENVMIHHSGSNTDGTFSGTGNVTGNSLADFMIGHPSASISNAANHSGTQKQYAAYIQDSFQVTRNLVIDMGLRYQLSPYWVGPENRQLDGGGLVKSTATYIQGQQSIVYTKAPLGLVYPASSGFGGKGDPGVPDGLVYTDKRNFGPRLGLAWDVFGTGRTSIRAAWGVFYTTQAGQGQDDTTVNLPAYYSFAIPAVPSLTNPLPASALNAVPIRLTPNVDFTPYLPTGVTFFDRHLRNPRVQQFNFTVQHQLPKQVTLQVAYVGNVANRLQQPRDINAPRYIPGNDALSRPLSTFTNGNDRRPDRDFTFLQLQESRVNSAYHSLQVQAQKRFSRGLSFLSAYTFSKTIDFSADTNGYARGAGGMQDFITPNLNAERALSNLHQAHKWVSSLTYYTPSLSRVVASKSNLAKSVLDNWELSGIVTFGSGFPFTVTSGRNYSLQSGADRPNLVGNPRLSSGRPRNDYLQMYFDPAAFQPNAMGTFGNAGRNLLIGPGVANVDVAVFKNLLIFEKKNLQLRFEFFNLPNRPNFSNPVSSLTSGAVGRILALAGPGRIIQIGGKFDF